VRGRRRQILGTVVGAVALLTAGAGSAGTRATVREGGIVKLAFLQLDYMDPAFAYSPASWALLDTTCARLMTYPDKSPPEGLRLVPEVAAALPKISRNGKTYTFALRKGFRFSDGKPVDASAFARAIDRAAALGDKTAAVQYVSDIAGAADVAAGKTDHAAGVVAHANTLVVHFTRPTLDFAAKTTMPFFCAVPPNLPSDPEGVRTFPAAGPYYVTEYRPGERVSLRRNPFYKGARPHHVEGFDAEITGAEPGEGLNRVERGDADWTLAVAPDYFEPGRRLAEKYGVNKSRFFVKPGFTIRQIVFNVSRPLFRNNPRLRRAINFALDRRALSEAVTLSPLAETQTDQFLPPSFPGYRNANIYPLAHSDVRRARALARGATRGGKATFYVPDFPPPVALAQLVKRQLARIGVDVILKPIAGSSINQRLSNPQEPWDLAILLWQPDFLDPYTYLNSLFDSQFIAAGANLGRFASPAYDRLMRRAARLQGPARYRAYGQLDVALARDAAPSAPTAFFTEPTFVSARLGCLVLRPTLDLTAVCLK
jgi:peptide/nickel transport system substrate-binding protein